MSTPQQQKDSGNATAEFVMVSALVILMFLGVLQVAFAMFTKNVIQDAASQGARYGAMIDRSPQDGAQRTRELLTAVLPDAYSADVTYTITQWHGADAVQVRVNAPIPLLGPFGLNSRWEVTGHAILPE
ncbi:TadE family protein [Rothia nasimurium]|uniref:TadE family protein n=1 Tax=Rothia nasimurium TaxID=85336 RepID=UPI001F2CADCA|nr:TadE family protein [Rothia nasimurium]